MHLQRLELVNFRNYGQAQIDLEPQGVTLFQGDNGSGKTNLLEAVAYLATLRSFRGSPKEALVAHGHKQSVLRASAQRDGRSVLVELELNLEGRDKVRLNRQPVRRHEELLGAVLVTIFSPDDIEVVKGPPHARRQYLDDLLVSLHPRHGALQAELERVLRQRNALLRDAKGALRGGMATTLDVWDQKLAETGQALAAARGDLVDQLSPAAALAYQKLVAPTNKSTDDVFQSGLTMSYARSWEGPLLDALAAARAQDVHRGATSVGPQRDDLNLYINGLAARAQSSQGEQRSAALALRLGGHALVTERRSTSPLLLLDDVFSELDPARSARLAHCLPPGQVLVSAAGPVPSALPVVATQYVQAGQLTLVQDRAQMADDRPGRPEGAGVRAGAEEGSSRA